MQYRSRIKSKVKNTLYKNTVLSVLAIIVIVFIILFFGLKVLVNLSLLIGRIKSANDISTSSQNEFVLPPRLNPTFEATNSSTIAISGIGSQPGDTVELYLNDEQKSDVLVDKNLQFTISELRLDTGENRIKAKTKRGGKESEFSSQSIVVFETTPPPLEITEPTDGQSIQKTPQVNVVGKTDPEATVSINEFLPIIGVDGHFSYTFPLKEGENDIKITSKDKAGNQTSNEIKVTFQP